MRELFQSLRCLLLAGTFVELAPAQDLPSAGGGNTLEFEPQIILVEPVETEATAKPDSIDIAKLEQELQKAKRKVTNDQRLEKQGILAKVEVERSALKVVLLQKQLSSAKLKAAVAACEAADDADAATKESANTERKQCEEAAKTDLAAYNKALLDAAALNLWRQQKLQAWGGASKAAVERARQQLATAKQLQEGDSTSAPAR